MGELSKLSAIVLAGGQSRRLGRDKALLLWQGRTLIEHIVAQLKELSDDVLVITGTERRYQELLDVPIFADEIKNIGPMGGLYTGLKRARYEHSLVVACDMPLFTKAITDLLESELDSSVWAIVPKVHGHRVPTLAIYHRGCLLTIEQLLAHGRTSLQALLDAVPVKIIPDERVREADPELRTFLNLNTLSDWEKLAHRAQ
ncbi:MAG: molybdenum cofactor guanylyltransferase [Candidatus Bipolaricaulota bacterium]|nr:molybdenum cofactor guanylyltransferase [Candidatus Bipolaricaulota bacterium]